MRALPSWAEPERDGILAGTLAVRIVYPSIVEPGERFTVRVSITGADQLPLEEPLSIRFVETGEWSGLPGQIECGPEAARIEDVALRTPGAHWLRAVVQAGKPVPVSGNPVLVEQHPASRLYFGDLHIHSSDGTCTPHSTRSPRYALDYIRHVSFLDFAAITDHAYGLTDRKWEDQRALVAEYDAPGSFVPILGFESSHASGFGGDNNAYFAGTTGTWYPPEKGSWSRTNPRVGVEKLWAYLDAHGERFLTIPHHTARAQKYRSWDEGRYDPSHEPLFEIYSGWGSSEERYSRFPMHMLNAEGPCYFRDAITRGCRFGVIASSDDHSSQPGSEARPGTPGAPREYFHAQKGLAAIRAPRLDRASLFEAMLARHTYATTFDRSIVQFESDGVPAAAEIDLDDATALSRRVVARFIAGSPHQGSIVAELIRNDLVIKSWPPVKVHEPAVFEYIDEDPFDHVAITGARYSPEPFVSYYMRFTYPGGGAAWTSPIWFVRR